MAIKVALPDLQPGWVGGVRYLSSLRIAVEALECQGVVEVVNRPRFYVKENVKRKKYGLLNGLTYSLDSIRGIDALNLPRPLGAFSKRSLAWIPDLQDIERPEFFSSEEILRRKNLRKKYLNRNRAFIFSSSHSLNVFNSIGYQEPLIAGTLRFTSIFESELEDRFSTLTCNGCKENGFFYLPNQWWVHKNHPWALESFLEYQKSGGTAHLVMTGTEVDSRWPDYSAHTILTKFSVKNVHRLGLVKRSLQRELYDKAIAVIQPSSYEGWSTTIEEALSLGAPVIASDIPSNSEQLVDRTDSLLIRLNSRANLTDALFSPPKKLRKIELDGLATLRWERFLKDLESVIQMGEKLTRECSPFKDR